MPSSFHSPPKLVLGLISAWLCALIPVHASAQTVRVQLGVLVLSDGEVGTAMVKAGLDEGLVPYTEVDLTASDRPEINEAFLSDVVEENVRRAKYQAVVLPSDAPVQLRAAELAALDSFEREFKIRELDAYVYPSGAVGLDSPKPDRGYSGPLDGMIATVTTAATNNGFEYLRSSVPIDDLSPTVDESYGYLAVPLPDDLANGRTFVPFIELAIPGAAQNGVIVGVNQDNGRERMVVTIAMNASQLHQQLLFPGMLEWLTYGVHLGHERYFLSVHIDDFLLSDTRWVPEHDCTIGDCPESVTAPDIIMNEADLAYLEAWQAQNSVKLDLTWNGQGLDQGDTSIQAGALTNPQFRWISHTYTHEYLGCIQDFSVVPWVCTVSEDGVQWASQTLLEFEIGQNQTFALERGIVHDPSALVTGQHSGLRRAPEEPSDNPGLANALDTTGVRWIGSDNSRESEQRQIGPALTVPRYPMNIFYNVGTKEEEVDEYNWIYTSVADGGSGTCELHSNTSTCIPPLQPGAGFENHIVPEQARQMIMNLLANSPKPYYAHQSNLAEDRILYHPLNLLLHQYRDLLSSDCPLVNPTMAQAGTELLRRAQWQSAKQHIQAYIQDQRLVVSAGADAPEIVTPVSVPIATNAPSLESFGSKRTGWAALSGASSAIYDLPESVRYARTASRPAAVPGTERGAALGLAVLLFATGIMARRRNPTCPTIPAQLREHVGKARVRARPRALRNRQSRA